MVVSRIFRPMNELSPLSCTLRSRTEDRGEKRTNLSVGVSDACLLLHNVEL